MLSGRLQMTSLLMWFTTLQQKPNMDSQMRSVGGAAVGGAAVGGAAVGGAAD